MERTANPLDPWTASKLGLGQSALSRTAIEDWQLRRLQETLAWARANSRFYNDHFAALDDWHPTSLKDVARLPFTTAADLQADPLRFVCVSQSDIHRVVTLDTSGTTGSPKRLFFTEDDQAITLDFFEHGLRLMAAPGDKVMILLPGDKPGSVGDLLVRAIRRLGGEPLLAKDPSDLMAAEAEAARTGLALVIGLPVQVLTMARLWREHHPSRHRVRRVLLCSDNVAQPVIDDIAAIWDCEVFQHWGMTELGYGGGVDCPQHCGFHLQEGDVLFEIVDLETGQPLPPGQVGEIVVTTLTRTAMPLIRYRTGDLSRFLCGPCACGSALRRLDRILTRKTGLIALSGGAVSMADLDEALFRIPGLANFSARITAQGTAATLSITASSTASAAKLIAAIRLGLDGLPTIHAARESGELAVEVAVTDETIPFSRQKRAIRREQCQ